jgi:hypothetical protein
MSASKITKSKQKNVKMLQRNLRSRVVHEEEDQVNNSADRSDGTSLDGHFRGYE